MDRFRALETFVAIVDRGSLTAAAEALGTSLPVVVRTLAALEARLGSRLIQRTTRRLSLTDDGRQYLERARRILADLDDADRALAATQAEPSGALAITAPVLFGQMHVAPIVQRFVAQHPRMRVQLLLLDRVVNLVEEGVDAGVRIGHLDDSSLVAQPVGAIRRVVVASPEFLARHGRPAHPRALAAQPCLRFSGLDGGQWAFREDGRMLQVAVQGPFECNLGAPMLEACAAGLGYARCLAYQAAPLLAAGRLEIVLDAFEVAPWPVHLVRPSARLLARRTRAFIDVLRPALQSALAAAPASGPPPPP